MTIEAIRECVERMDIMLDSQVFARLYLIPKRRPD